MHEDQGEVWLKVDRGYDPPDEAVTVEYAFTDVTAKAGEDYVAVNGTLVFAAGERSKSIRVPVINDQVLEANETFRVVLRNPSAGFLPGLTANQTCTLTIVDATGLEARRFKGIQHMANGGIRLNLAGGVSKPFSQYYSIFQLEASTDLVQWQPLPLSSYLNGSTEPPSYIDLPAPGQASRFYRLNSSFLINPAPPPTGPYAVGTFKQLVTDPARRNRYRVSTNGSFMITVWYPAVPRPGRTLEPYDDPATAQDLANWDVAFMDRGPRFTSYSFAEAPLRQQPGGYPVVLYSHGGGTARKDNESLAETLASYGYIVVAPDHGSGALMEFPDGTVYMVPPVLTIAELQDRVRDLQFVCDILEMMQQSDVILAGGLDMTRVGAMGWSYGTMTAGEFCRLDNRGKVAISLDWGFGADGTAPDLFAAGLKKPSLMLNASDNQSDLLFRTALNDAYWIQINNTVHLEFSTWGYWMKPNSLPATREVSRTIHAYALSFLNKYLKGQDDHLLDGPSHEYPRVMTFKKK